MNFRLFRPMTLSEAVQIQNETDGEYLAGGTVSLVNRHHGKKIGDVQISLDRIGELREIVLTEGWLSIGSMVTMDELEQSEHVKKYAKALWTAASQVGGPQIRNRATLGGNLAAASPSSDCAPPLLALNASLKVCGRNGEREIPVRDFFKGYLSHALSEDEIITSIRIPITPGAVSVFRKVGKRNALSVSCLNMAVAKRGKDISVSVGACAPVPVYCRETSQFLSAGGERKEAIAILQEEICPIDDKWGTASYRRAVCANLLKELVKETEEAG